MEEINGKRTNSVWQKMIRKCHLNYDYISEPRGMEVREVINGSYSISMPAFIDLSSRENLNIPFMFAEAAWVVEGSNKLSDLEKYMKKYAEFSDDKIFLKGAYGPKILDQLPYIIGTLLRDQDSRQAVLTIWRERPGGSKDIPCTVAMQFLIRDGKLNLITTMRSQDIVLGYTYDVFTFSMVALAVKLLLKEKKMDIELGRLFVNAGSLHLYEQHYDSVDKWVNDFEVNESVKHWVKKPLEAESYQDLIDSLKDAAHDSKFYPNKYKKG